MSSRTRVACGQGFGGVSFGPCVCLKESIEENATPTGEQALQLLHKTIEAAQRDLDAGTSQSSLSRELAESYQAMLSDPTLLSMVASNLKTGQRLISAIRNACQAIAQTMAAAGDDSYIASRANDIIEIGALLITKLSKVTSNWPPSPGSVLIAAKLTVPQTLQIAQLRLAGLVLEVANPTSHVALLAQASGIPVIIGAKGASKLFRNGDIVHVDGGRGRLSQYAGQPNAKAPAHDDQLPTAVETADGADITLLANLQYASELEGLPKTVSIGLFRTELLVLSENRFPSQQEFRELGQRALRATANDVVFRLYDFGADKVNDVLSVAHATNPALDIRGARLWSHPKLKTKLTDQIRGLAQANASGRIKFLVPFVSTLDEALLAKELVETTVRQVSDAAPSIGTMIEVPSAVFLVEELAGVFDFLSIGTNDLLQYLFAADRENPELESLHNPLQPAALRLLGRLFAQINHLRIPTTVCGNAASVPLSALALVGLGARRLSMPVSSMNSVRKAIEGITLPDLCRVMDKAKACTTLAEVDAMLKAFSV